MEGLRVYYDLTSQPSRAVILFLKLTKIPFIDNALSLRKSEHLTEDYGKINPFHLVPAIDDDGFILTESVAILKYLCAKFSIDQTWYPSDLQARARVDQYCAWQHTNVHVNASGVFNQQVIEPQMMNIPINQERLRQFENQLEVSMDQLEEVFLRDRDYLAGEEITIADILGICDVMQVHACGFLVAEGRPKVAAWMGRVREKLQPHFDEVHVELKRLFKIHGTGLRI